MSLYRSVLSLGTFSSRDTYSNPPPYLPTVEESLKLLNLIRLWSFMLVGYGPIDMGPPQNEATVLADYGQYPGVSGTQMVEPPNVTFQGTELFYISTTICPTPEACSLKKSQFLGPTLKFKSRKLQKAFPVVGIGWNSCHQLIWAQNIGFPPTQPVSSLPEIGPVLYLPGVTGWNPSCSLCMPPTGKSNLFSLDTSTCLFMHQLDGCLHLDTHSSLVRIINLRHSSPNFYLLHLCREQLSLTWTKHMSFHNVRIYWLTVNSQATPLSAVAVLWLLVGHLMDIRQANKFFYSIPNWISNTCNTPFTQASHSDTKLGHRKTKKGCKWSQVTGCWAKSTDRDKCRVKESL